MKFTMKQFNQKFPTSDACLDHLWKIRFGSQPCHKCGLYDSFHKIPNRPAFQCVCGKQIYPLANTIFHKSDTDLRTWFLAIFFMTNTRSGMSALQFHRITGVTYKCAWRIFGKIRTLMSDDGLLSGLVQVDETFFQAKPQRDMRLPRGKRTSDAEIVFGAVSKDGVRATS